MIVRVILTMALLLLLNAVARSAPRTMRLDYYHTGDSRHEIFSIDRIVVEPLPWPGNPSRPIDDTNRGKYLFEVRDRRTNKLIYSRGFSSIYGEWETTDEARDAYRTFSESVRFPCPDAPVQIVLKKRGQENAFREIWSTILDPKMPLVDDSRPPSPGPLIANSEERRSSFQG
jgi:hypothetical protein